MRGVVVVVALLIGSPAIADEAPSLDAALAKAVQSGKPLVIEFYADWCTPCRYFDAKVLPRADVAAALKSVEFVRYDIDASPGEEIAEQLGVTGVPTFMVLDANGKVLARHAGLGGGGQAPHQWFINLLARGGKIRASTEELEAAVAAQPNDVSARLKLARHYREIARVSDAGEQFAWVADNATAHRELAAEAAAERDAMLGAEARLSSAVEMAEQFVATYPESRLSSSRIVALGYSGRVARGRLLELVQAHLDATPREQFPDAVRAALLVHADVPAHVSLRKRLRAENDDPLLRLIDAEIDLFRGQLAIAAPAIEKACKQGGYELWCFMLRQAIDLKRNTTPGIERLRAFATDYLRALGNPEPRTTDIGIHTLDEVDTSFGNAVGAVFASAQEHCEHLARRFSTVMVVLELASLGRPVRVDVRGRDDALARCVRRVVGAAALPEAPAALNGHLHGAITFDAWRGANRPKPYVPFSGVLPQIAVRRGDLETTGFRGDFVLEIGKGNRVRWLAGGTAEFAGADTGNPAYRLRALAGAAAPLFFAPRVTLVELLGVGVRDLGTEAPRALEWVVGARLIVPVGPVRLHALADYATTEGSYGLGASVPIGSVRLYLGGQRGHVGDLATTMFVIGTAIGDVY